MFERETVPRDPITCQWLDFLPCFERPVPFRNCDSNPKNNPPAPTVRILFSEDQPPDVPAGNPDRLVRDSVGSREVEDQTEAEGAGPHAKMFFLSLGKS